MHDDSPFPRSVVIRLTADVPDPASIAEVGLFLYDLDSLYEVLRLGLDSRYKDYRFSRFSLYRNGRPMAHEDKMRVKTIGLGSPLEVMAVIAAGAGAAGAIAATVWTVAQTIDKIYNLRLNHQKLQLEVDKLRREEAQARLPLLFPRKEFDSEAALRKRNATEPLDALVRRLQESPLRVTDVDIRVVGDIAEGN
jgi:hypothetical protein